MRFSAVLCLFAATLAVATPLQAREETEDVALVDDEVGSSLPVILLDEDNVAPPANITDTEPDDGEDDDDLVARDLEDRDLQKRKLQKLQWNFKWDLKKSKFSGDTLIEFNQSGWVRFKTYFKNKGYLTRRYAIACALRDSDGRPYTLARSGKVWGKIRPFKSHEKKVDESRLNQAVKTRWTKIVNGNRRLECTVQVRSNFSAAVLKDLLNKAIELVKKWGPIISGAVAIF